MVEPCPFAVDGVDHTATCVDGEEGLFHSFVEDEVEEIALLGVFSEDFALLGVVQFPRQHRTIGIDGDDATPEALGHDADGSSVV